MRNRLLLGLLCLIFFGWGVPATDFDADPYSNQPRIIIQNGNLILKSANTGNISLVPGAQGTILINGADVTKVLAGQAGSASSRPTNVMFNLVMSQEHKVLELTDQVSQLEENITLLTNRIDRFMGSGQGAISNRGFRRVRSKVQTLEEKVNALTRLLTANECESNPCRNGGTCVDRYNGFTCKCPSNFEGVTCESDVNECAQFAGTRLGCQNGATCINTHGGYSCHCPANWNGVHCTEKHDDCSTASHQELCGHGTCVDEKRVVPGQPKYTCICDQGWTKSGSSPACSEDIDECSGADRRCSQNPLVDCINIPGSFRCGRCPAGYDGDGYSCTDINECNTNNGGCSTNPFVQCANTMGSRTCGPCPTGYAGNGVQCRFVGVCSVNRGGCHPLATCIENTAITGTFRECRCPDGYVGNGEGLTGCIQSAGMTCASNPCRHGRCQVVGQSFQCICDDGYSGTLCDLEDIDACYSQPCQNGGTCTRYLVTFSCTCPEGYEGATCADRINSCGGFLTGNNGSLRFPESGMTYDHLKNCAWVITVHRSKVVNVTFEHFDLEHGANCEFDFLQLNDGPTAASRVLGRFCQNDLHGVSFPSTHNELYLWFQSDKTIASTGFSLHWTAVDPVCGGEIDTSDYGAINSPGYPGVYPHNRTCSWLVQVPVGKRIQFHFATLRLESHDNCSFDYLKIFDGATDRDRVIGTYCTTVTPPPVTTSGHSALLLFHSDNSVPDTGFHISYSSQSSIQGCGGTLTYPTGTISSPNFPDVYLNNLNCEWLIRIHQNNRIKLTFKEFHLEHHTNCAFDFVEVFAGDSDAAPLVGRYCGATLPGELLSDSDQLFIRFKSDNSLVQSGFKAEYKTICGGLYTDSRGTLTSPYYPDKYPARATCLYEIRLDPGYLINVTFHSMDIEQHSECRFDYLQIRDGDSEESPLIDQLCGSRIPENFVTTYNRLWMRFETDGSIQSSGFYAQYEAVEIGCGGVLTDPSGQISSPRHPDRYPHSLTCSWYLKAPPGHVIRLTFTAFILEPDKECRFDYVLVQDLNGSQLGRYCGSRKPPILTSMEESMFVVFVADANVARDGFIATYEFLSALEACGGTFYQESGVIRSPGYPKKYPHEAHCIWILRGREERQISLNVTNFDMEEHLNCRYDFLEIRNGGYETSPLIGRYCGKEILKTIRSHSNALRLEFKSDGSMTDVGFEIYFDSTATGCGGRLTSPSGSIVSPNYPQAYPLNADCEWLIQVSAGSRISLAVIDIDIEEHQDCLYDYVQVFDGDSENSKSLFRLCNNQQNPGSIVSSGNALLVRFRSDFNQEAGGFHLAYQTVCNNQLTKRSGVIESPNFPDTYPHNHNCTWIIEAPLGSNVSLAFSHLILEGGESCEADYVEVLEAKKSYAPEPTMEYVQLGKFCGNVSRPPNTIVTSTNTAVVRLVTDSSIAREGFRLEWRTKGCGGEIRDKSYGNISSPNYPHGYATTLTCIWHIIYQPGERVELTIRDLDLEHIHQCEYDYLRVYSGEDEDSPRLLNMCERSNGSEVVTSHGNHMLVKFHSDEVVTLKGFLATFKKLTGGCGGRFTAHETTILTPNFPNPYNANDDCNWLIQVEKSRLVLLDFYDFDMPQDENCTKGYVAIYDGPNSNSPLLTKHCGGKPEGTLASTGNQMLIRLVADGNNVGKGFRAHYKMGCGQRLLADEGGEISSPNYPHFPPNHENCSWIIYSSDPGQKVSLIVTDLHTRDGINCTSSPLRVWDGDRPDSPLISEHCGNQSPPPILSRGSILHVLNDHGLFRATYGLASTHCGGSYNSLRGTFTSPGFPYNYDMEMECVWTIETSVGNKVHLTFESFHLEESDFCNRDYLEIHENDESGRLIGRYCGNRIPSNVTDAHKLWLKFRSDDLGTQTGFMAHYELQHGAVLNGSVGEVSSPGYPREFRNRDEYHWTIFVPSGQFISLRFLDISIMEISGSRSCGPSVRIYDGIDDKADLLGNFCGFQIPEPVVSTGNVVFIKYSRSRVLSNKFHLQWTAVTDSGIVVDIVKDTSDETCWEEMQLNVSESMVVTSLGYPSNYPNNVNCTYILRSPIHQHVELRITDLEMEGYSPSCGYDKLDVYYMTNPNVNDWQLNTTLCERLNSTLLLSPTNLMKLVFKTDGFINYKGFHALAASSCGTHFQGSHGIIKSEFILPYLSQMSRYNGFSCVYLISVRQRRTIQFTFDRFNVASDSVCSSNYIMLKNGGSNTSPNLGNGKYCGSTIPGPLETSSNKAYMFINIASLSSGAPDFQIRFSEVSVGCGGHLYIAQDSPYVEFSSPNYPNPPIHDTECEWTIISPSGTRMRLDFDEEFHMSTDCYSGENTEYIQIFDGGTEMADPLHRFCGHDQPSSVMSTGNSLFVRYVTAVDSPQSGFKAKVGMAVCGGTISAFYGIITSPNYPSSYGNSQECEWFVKMMWGYNLVLNLTDFSTPEPAIQGQPCNTTDFLEIRNIDAQGEVLGTFCGTVAGSQIITVPGPFAYVKFKSDYGRTGKGFSMIMDAEFDEGCGGYLSDSASGVITSPKYPNALTARRNCYWRINAPEGRRVKLTFQEFNLPKDESSGICLSYIRAFNLSFSEPNQNENRICGNVLPPPIHSSGPTLYLSLFTYGLGAGQGFQLTYTTEESDTCGGVLPWPSGTISMLNISIETTPESALLCRWRLSGEGQENQTAVFRFDVLDLPGHMANYCRNGSLYIFGGEKRDFLGHYCGNYMSDVIVTSPYPTTVLSVAANTQLPMRGVHATYNVSNCGGLLAAESADFWSPGYPDPGYPASTDCHWIIRAPAGETLTLSVIDMRLEDNCEKDYIIIRNGGRIASPMLNRLCGSHIPTPITSTGNTMSVIFHSDAFGSAKGFRMTTNEVQRGCGGLVHHLSGGNITSPKYPTHYDNNVECKWVIDFLPGYLVKIEFSGRFDIEMEPNCQNDYLLFEEVSGDWSQSFKKCGSTTPPPFISKTRKLTITFHTNDHITADGFYIKYTAVCGGNFTDTHGEVLSPNYPNFYDDNMNCTYTIGEPHQYVSLTFDDYFSIETNPDCLYDYIQVFHSNVSNETAQGPYCGTEVPESRTLQGPVTIQFITDMSYPAHGFRVKYEILTCGATLTDPEGVISFVRTFSNGIDCTWQILAPSDRVIVLRFTYFNLDIYYNCHGDFLEIRDGLDSGPLIGTLCGDRNTTIVKSTGNSMTLKLHMYYGRPEKGFSAVYRTTYGVNQGCGGTLNNVFNGEIQSLDADTDGFYEPDLDCNWLIIGNTTDQVIQVTFDRFDIEASSNNTCDYDFIELREDISPESALIGRYCGTTPPVSITTSANRMSVLFHSDGKINKAGFKLRFQMVMSPCGTSLLTSRPEAQTLTSPNYPNAYPTNLQCSWTLWRNSTRSSTEETVQLTIDTIDIPCDGDYLEIQKMKYSSLYIQMVGSDVPIRLCGATAVHDVIASSGLSLTFHSNSINNGARGFSISYKHATCNRNYTADSGVIRSSGYPGYVSEDKCNMAIEVSPGKTISLYFYRMHWYDKQGDCADNHIKVYDGLNMSAPILGTFCGYSVPDPIFSTGSSLYIESNTKYKSGLFYMNYMSADQGSGIYQGKGCGGSIFAEKGAISSPLYPHVYFRENECKWFLTVPGYHTMKLEFSNLNLNSTAGCDSNYVEIYDGHSDQDSERVVRYCGSDSPGAHISKGNQVMVKFKSDIYNSGIGFLLTFNYNKYSPDSSSLLIQRHSDEEIDVSQSVIYL